MQNIIFGLIDPNDSCVELCEVHQVQAVASDVCGEGLYENAAPTSSESVCAQKWLCVRLCSGSIML